MRCSSKDPDEMQHTAAFNLGQHCFVRVKQPQRTEIHHYL